MSRTLLTLALSVCSALLLACGGADNANHSNTTNATNANRAATNATTSTAPATTTTPASSTAAAAGDKIGVAECDDFITKYDDCVTAHVPEAARAQFKATVEQWRKSWRDVAANPQTRPTLVQTCKQAVESAKQSMKAYNCAF